MHSPSNQTLRLIRLLGYGGLLPFIALALLVYFAKAPALQSVALEGLALYAVTILSFVGAVSWGIALADPVLSDPQRRRLFIFSVLPALMVWLAWFLPAGRPQLLSLAALTLIIFLIDRRHGLALGWPLEWIRLRQHLSLTVTFCLLFAASA
jgi:hypothetical protein